MSKEAVLSVLGVSSGRLFHAVTVKQPESFPQPDGCGRNPNHPT